MNVLIIGRRGLGKSTLADFVASELNSSRLVFDANGQYKNADVSTSDLKKFIEALDRAAKDKKDFTIAYVPKGNIELEWERFASALWGNGAVPIYGDYSLIIDEAHRLQRSQYVSDWLDRFMRQAPRRERGDEAPVDVIQCFHRPQDIHGIVLALADIIYFFRVSKRRDLENIEKEFDPEIREAIETLRTPDTEPYGRDVLRIDVESNSFVLLRDPNQWYKDIRTKKEPHGHFPNLEARYGD
jgi:hypothetical protein